MYLSRELWRFTAGVRWRIAWAVLIGLAAVVAGIARLALLGWLLARVLAGPTLPSLLLAVGLVAAVTVLRGCGCSNRRLHTRARPEEVLGQRYAGASVPRSARTPV